VADILLQSGGFGLIAVDLSGISERVVRKVPLSSWFRFSRVIEKYPAALVFIEQEPHATSCAALVLRVVSEPTLVSSNLLTQLNLKVEIVRSPGKKMATSERKGFSLRTQWA
jgi:recombination protein RecA